MNFLPPHTTVDVVLTALPSLSEIEVQWRDLETRADGTFFTSWTWIGAWLATRPEQCADLQLMTARSLGQLVGLAVIGRRTRALPAGRWATVHVNQSGLADDDSIYIEYNDFLIDRACVPAVRRAMLSKIMAMKGDNAWGTCRFSGVRPAMLQALAREGIRFRFAADHECAWTELERFGPGLSSYLATLSRNTRQQIQQSLRLLAADGSIGITVADGSASIQHALADLQRLHQKGWQERKGKAGAFTSERFKAFVDALIVFGSGEGAVQFFRVTSGDQTLGVLLNFIHRGHVYAYQSGFNYRMDNRVRPGLVSHALAIAWSREQGLQGYHFMAGEGRYKSSLANATERLSWVILRHDDPLSRIEDWGLEAGRRAKTLIRSLPRLILRRQGRS